MLKKSRKFSTGFLRPRKGYRCIRDSSYMVIKCYECYVGCFQQFNIRYLQRFTIISSVHGAFSLSIIVHTQNIGTELRNVY